MKKTAKKSNKKPVSSALEFITKLDKQLEAERLKFEQAQYKYYKELFGSYPSKLLIEEVLRMGRNFDKDAPTNYGGYWEYAKHKYGDGCIPVSLPKLDRTRLIERMARLRSGYDGK